MWDCLTDPRTFDQGVSGPTRVEYDVVESGYGREFTLSKVVSRYDVLVNELGCHTLEVLLDIVTKHLGEWEVTRIQVVWIVYGERNVKSMQQIPRSLNLRFRDHGTGEITKYFLM